MMGQRERNVYPLYGQTKYTGSIEFPLFPLQGIEFLVGAIGADAISGTADPWTHTITPSNTLFSYTIEKNIGGSESEQYAGCRVGKLDIDCPATDQEVRATAEIIAQKVAVLTTPTTTSYTSTDVPFVFSQATLTALGASRIDATSVKMSLTNNLKATYTLAQSADAQYITPLARQANGQITVVWSSLDDATYGYLKKMPVAGGSAATGTLVLALTQSASRSITITLQQIQLSKLADDIKLGDVTMATLDFEASYVIGSNLMQAVVKSSKATQY